MNLYTKQKWTQKQKIMVTKGEREEGRDNLGV